MANILETINVEHGGQLWASINANPRLADFHRMGFRVSYSWDDVYDVIAYERLNKMESFISAMMAVNLVKGKIRSSYLAAADVFSGAVDDRLHDIYSELYILFLRRIPAWDMSRGVYLDKFLALDIDSCVRKTSNFAVYGTGTGQDGPGAALSLQTLICENAEDFEKNHKKAATRTSDNGIILKEMVGNSHGEAFEMSERRVDMRPSTYLAAHAVTTHAISEEELQAIAFAHKFKVALSPQAQRAATNAMKNYINAAQEENMEYVV